MTSDRERFEFQSEKCEEIAEFRLFLRISGRKSLGRLVYQNNLPNMEYPANFEDSSFSLAAQKLSAKKAVHKKFGKQSYAE